MKYLITSFEADSILKNIYLCKIRDDKINIIKVA